MDEKGFETLVGINHCTKRWYPQSIATYRNAIKLYGDYSNTYPLYSNFAYSMQYIEYLEKQISELNLSDVIITMVYKSYIITAMSIIEELFVNIIHNNNRWNTSTWKEKAKYHSNPQGSDGSRTKVDVIVYEECEEYDMRMDLDSMIKKIESHHLLSIDHGSFPELKRLRELRNRVHLQVGNNTYDHDYNSIGANEIQLARKLLFAVLTASEVCQDESVFQFIMDAYNL